MRMKNGPPNMKHCVGQLIIKAEDQNAGKGTFSGIASAFNVLDHDRDIIRPGSFDESIAEHMKNGTLPAMFWMHSAFGGVVGDWDSLEPTQHGLMVKGHLFVDSPTEEVTKARNLTMSKGPKALSVGFTVPQGGAQSIELEDGTRAVEIIKATLWEISLVPFGANPQAIITEAKSQSSLVLGNELCNVAQAERFLCEVGGLSAKQAKTLIQQGWGGLTKPTKPVTDQKADFSEIVKSLETMTRSMKELTND